MCSVFLTTPFGNGKKHDLSHRLANWKMVSGSLLSIGSSIPGDSSATSRCCPPCWPTNPWKPWRWWLLMALFIGRLGGRKEFTGRLKSPVLPHCLTCCKLIEKVTQLGLFCGRYHRIFSKFYAWSIWFARFRLWVSTSSWNTGCSDLRLQRHTASWMRTSICCSAGIATMPWRPATSYPLRIKDEKRYLWCLHPHGLLADGWHSMIVPRCGFFSWDDL